jgi:predicted small integral membrane protein
MSGLDELSANPSGPTGAPREGTLDRTVGSRKLGILGLALGLLAFVAQLGGIATGIAVIGVLSQTRGDPSSQPGDIGWVLPYEVAVVFGSLVLGLAGMIVGVTAARRRRGPRFGILGAVFGGLALTTDLLVAAFVALGLPS